MTRGHVGNLVATLYLAFEAVFDFPDRLLIHDCATSVYRELESRFEVCIL
jgi:hypothetical protein